jgi:acyl-CoA reductase-like NAD-dependent aldehyde dehydrogenase
MKKAPRAFAVHEPLGVIYTIEPWNFPYYQVVRVAAAQILAGDPRDPATQLAPPSTQKAADNLAAEVTEAIEGGATAETLGQPVPAQGAFFQPTILTDVSPENPAFQTEFFGPVSMVFRVADEDEAVDLANASRYGLGGSVFSRDTVRGERVARRIETGMVFVNHPTAVKADIPFGGVKVAASRSPATATSSPSSASASSSPIRSSTSSTSTPRSDPSRQAACLPSQSRHAPPAA